MGETARLPRRIAARIVALCMLSAVSLSGLPAGAYPGEVRTVAGGGVGDGGDALQGALREPVDLVADAAGNVFIADAGHLRLRLVEPSGRISTLAGSLYPVQGSIDGPATIASFGAMGAVAAGPGAVYVAEPGPNRLRKVAGGFVTTVQAVEQPTPGGPLPATGVTLFVPSGVAVDAGGNIYVSESGRSRVIRINAADGVVTVVAGTGTAGFSGDGGPATAARLNSPGALAFDAAGGLVIADSRNFRIRRVDPSGVIATVAGNGSQLESGDGGAATAAGIGTPTDVAVDSSGAILIANLQRVRRATAGVIQTIAILPGVRSVAALPNGTILWMDATSVYALAPGGQAQPFAGTGLRDYGGDGGPATAAALDHPTDVAFDAAGNLFVADHRNHRIRKVSPAGTITTIAGRGVCTGPSEDVPATQACLRATLAVRPRPDGRIVFVAYDPIGGDSPGTIIVYEIGLDGIVRRIAGGGCCAGEGGQARSAPLFKSGFADVAVDSSGNIFVTERSRVRKVTPGGLIFTVAGHELLEGFAGDGGPATQARLRDPTGLAIDPAGNLFIADFGNKRIRRVAPNGVITTVLGTGEEDCIVGLLEAMPAAQACLLIPISVAFLGGTLVFHEYARVRAVIDGRVYTVAGLPVGDSSPWFDGLPVSQVSGGGLDTRNGLVVWADFEEDRVRSADPALV